MVINRVDAVKYLAITIDEKLTWNAHVEYVCNSLIKIFGIFKQLRHNVTANTVRQLYHAFIYSKIKYGLEVYGNTCPRDISKLSVIQKSYLNINVIWHKNSNQSPAHNTRHYKSGRYTQEYCANFCKYVSHGKIPRNIQSILLSENHALRNKTGREFRYAIPQNRIRCSISESSRSQTLEQTGKNTWKNINSNHALNG